jgi:hypothetical protein
VTGADPPAEELPAVDPVLQFSPPLIAGPAEFGFIEATLRSVLTEAWKAGC